MGSERLFINACGGRGAPPRPLIPSDRTKGSAAAAAARRGRVRTQTAVVHKMFLEYEDAIRDEREACGPQSLATLAYDEDDLHDLHDLEPVAEAGWCSDMACLDAKARTQASRRRLLEAARALNEIS